MTEKLIGAAILGVAIVAWVWAQNQELYALHEHAYGLFTLAAIIAARRASA